MAEFALSKQCTVHRKINRSKLIVSCVILLLTLGVVGVGTWGLTDSIKDTNHQVDTAWGLVDDASNRVRPLVYLLFCLRFLQLNFRPLLSTVTGAEHCGHC